MSAMHLDDIPQEWEPIWILKTRLNADRYFVKDLNQTTKGGKDKYLITFISQPKGLISTDRGVMHSPAKKISDHVAVKLISKQGTEYYSCCVQPHAVRKSRSTEEESKEGPGDARSWQ